MVFGIFCWLQIGLKVHFLICTGTNGTEVSGIATTTNACTCTPAAPPATTTRRKRQAAPAPDAAVKPAPIEVNCVCPNAAAAAAVVAGNN